jgi:B12-binding domain/radical SAM domain protein
MRNTPDLLLLHAPSVYDFRKASVLFGPISDVVPSTPAFEMYPLGFSNIASALEEAGLRTRIYNLAFRMLKSPSFDVEDRIRRFRPGVFGIDLHWLVHAHGALAVAEMCKRHHPSIPVLLGGLSASYYHEELVARPEVDFVLRGDSTEASTARLVRAVRNGDWDFSHVPNLTWTDETGALRVNPMDPAPEVLGGAPNLYLTLFRMAARYADPWSMTAIHDWWRYPVTCVLTFRGCKRNCTFCGGSASTFRNFYGRDHVGYRPAELVVHDVKQIARFTGAPIFLLGDPLDPGREWTEELLEGLARAKVPNHIVVELYRPVDRWFYDRLADATASFNVELSPESHDDEIRQACGKTYSMHEVEQNLHWALDRGCHRFDLFFMVGLPRQDRASVMATVDYCADLMKRTGPQVLPFISALTPFLDPGSPIFENPRQYGFRRLLTTLEEHRRALEEPSWEFIMNYETDWMSRRDIAEVTYEAGLAMNEAKHTAGRTSREQYETVRRNAELGRRLLLEIREIRDSCSGEEQAARLGALKKEMDQAGISSICEKSEFRWPTVQRDFRFLEIAKAILTEHSGNAWFENWL